MTGPRLSAIWRHPLKAIGREALESVTLSTGAWMPWDRVWAVEHANSKPLDGGWAHKMNFLRGVTDPSLMAITAAYDEASGTLTLDHPAAGQIVFNPDAEDDRDHFLEWAGRVWSSDLPLPTGIYKARDAHLSDVPEAWISINSTASLAEVSARAGQDLSPDRWRGNLWIDGMTPWAEFDLVGRKIVIGDVELKVHQPITRCKATMANPTTGVRDADTLGVLQSFGHQDFGVYAEVITGGEIKVGQAVEFRP